MPTRSSPSRHHGVLASLAVSAAALLAPQASPAAPVVNPFAADLGSAAYTASAAYQHSMIEAFFNGGYWNAGSWGTYWLQADMGVSHTLSEVKLLTDQLPYGVTDYQVFVSDTAIGWGYGALTAVAHHHGFTYTGTLLDLDFAATSGRYLQIVANGGPSWTALGGGARVDWVDSTDLGVGGMVPEPASLALVLGGLAIAGLQRGRRLPQWPA